MISKNLKTRRTDFRLIGISLLFLLFTLYSFGQTVVSGSVSDSLNEPLPYINILIKDQAKNEVVDGTLTDQEGRFEINVAKIGSFLLEASSLGYQTQSFPSDSLKNPQDIQIHLKESSEALATVVLEATRPIIEQKPDRFVFNVEQTTSGSIGTARDALKSTPSLKVEEDKIELVGKGEVRVMINDKLVRLTGKDLQTYLSSIPSDNIKSIEVISTPPSKYEAEGNSGLVNIVLKEAKEDSWSNSVRTHYRQGFYPSYGIGDAFLYHQGKLEIAASIDVNKGYIRRLNGLTLYFEEGPWIEPIIMKDKSDRVSGNFNLDYKLTDKAAVGLSYSGGFRKNDVIDHIDARIFNNEWEEIGQLNASGSMKNPVTSHTAGGYYEQKLDTLGRKLSVSLDYFGYENRQDRQSQTEAHYEGQEDTKIRNLNNQHIDNYSLSVDMEHPMEWARLSYGGKLLFTQNRNRLKEELQTIGNTEPSIQEDHFKYQENVQAFYADVTKNFNEKWTVKAGLRFENTATKGVSRTEEDFSRSYGKWFPSVFLDYTANADHGFNLSYSRRIARPGFWALNPARWYINSISYTEGNPFLQPTFTDNVELKHSFKNKLFSTVFFTYEDQGSSQIPLVNPETNQQIYKVDNFYHEFSYGIKEVFVFNPTTWWKTTSQASLTYRGGDYKRAFADLGTFQTGMDFDFYTDHNFYLNADKTLQLQATYTYSSPKSILMFKMDDQSSFDIGFKALLLDKKLETSLKFSDVFKGRESKLTTYTSGIKQEYSNYFDSQNVNVSLVYKFGNDNLTSKKREAKNKAIQDRAN